MTNKDIVSLASTYAESQGLTLSTVATYSSGSGRTFGRLLDGQSITLSRLQKILQWFSDRWPADLPWPSDIPRPTPNSTPKEAA